MENSRLIEELPEYESMIEVDDNSSSLLEIPNGTASKAKSDVPSDKTGDMYLYKSDAYPSDDIILLERLCRLGYFNGEHHLEEIMYLENIRRSQLLKILDKFRDVLITSENEDPAMAMFYTQTPS